MVRANNCTSGSRRHQSVPGEQGGGVRKDCACVRALAIPRERTVYDCVTRRRQCTSCTRCCPQQSKFHANTRDKYIPQNMNGFWSHSGIILLEWTFHSEFTSPLLLDVTELFWVSTSKALMLMLSSYMHSSR